MAAVATSYIVTELRRYLTRKMIERGGDGLMSRLEGAIRRWRRSTGNSVDVPIYGPDGELLKLVKREETE